MKSMGTVGGGPSAEPRHEVLPLHFRKLCCAEPWAFWDGALLRFFCSGKVKTNLASRWEGVGFPRASGKSPDLTGSFPNFPGSFSATSPEVLSLWN